MYYLISFIEPRIPSSSRGRLTDRLIAQGLLTPGMLSELRKEWDARKEWDSSKQQQQYHNTNTSDSLKANESEDSALHKNVRRKRRK